jgi:hypothetical protein
MARTQSPTARESLLPSRAAERPLAGILMSATSVAGSRPTMLASYSSPVASVTLMSVASFTTWLFVRM